MERTFSQDDRIRRAEEIYARRQSLREKAKKARINVQKPEVKNFKLFKRLAMQIIICILIYYIFYLINTTNYSFSEDTLSKTRELITYDFDFGMAYKKIYQSINEFLFKSEEAKDNSEEDANEENLEETDNSVDDESVNQSEISFTDENETERIKQNYSFILPLSGTISSEYGEREVTSNVMTAYHKGIDIAANSGTSILSSTGGKVITSKYSNSYGNYVVVQDNEVKTVYAHCSKLLVNVRR